MSHYSTYQVSHYKKLFNKYASHESGMLALPDLYLLMVQFGMEICIERLKSLVYLYDSNRLGLLDFDDFLIFLGDYEACRNEERERIERAFSHFQRKIHGHGGVTKNDLRYILQLGDNPLPPDQIRDALQDYLGDTRAETTIKMSDFYSKNFSLLAWCDHSPHQPGGDLVRDLVIRSLVLYNLSSFARTKLRKGCRVEYFTLDPFITIECAGVSQETTILVGETQPIWNQDIMLQIKFPATTDFFELQRWIEGQRVVFHLFDYISTGNHPHKEWIASGYLPLSKILTSASNGHGLSASVELRFPSLSPSLSPFVLDVSAFISSDRLTPFFELPEEIWVSKYHPKMRQDLQYGLRATDDAERGRENAIVAGNASHVFWEYYSEFYQQLKSKFRRRYFQLVGLNEYNQFWCLSCFVRPLFTNGALNTPELLAENVARIETNQLIPSSGYRTHTTQVASPALVLFRKYGSTIEHAILLCDLFLGLGLNAFVCIGTCQSERTAWVVTFDNTSQFSYSHYNQSSFPFPHDNGISAPNHSLARSRSNKGRNINNNINNINNINNNKLARSGSDSGNGSNVLLRQLSEIIISPPASDDESDDDRYDEAIAFAKQNFVRKIDTNSVDLAVGQDVFSLIENLSKKKYTKKKKAKATVSTASNTQKNILDKTKEKSQAVTLLQKVIGNGKDKMLHILNSKNDNNNNTQNKNLTASSLLFEDSKFLPPSLPSKNVSLWDPTTGKCYKTDSQASLSFHIGCIFNSQNVWVNTQKYEQASRIKWDLDRVADWFPFLDDDIKENCGPIQCWYSEPTQLSDILQEEPGASNKLVAEFVSSIQLYRSSKLKVPETAFFSPICKILQNATKQCEELMHKKEPGNRVEQEFINMVDKEILSVLPDHHSWFGRPYHFYHSNVDEIIKQIEWTGIINCSVPQALYAVGAQVFNYPWGLQSVWVYVGYTFDLFYDV